MVKKEVDLFFKENLYNFLSRNDSMFNKFETNSIKVFSYINSKDLLMKKDFKTDYELYLRYRKNSRFEVYENIEDYFDKIRSFLENEKINESHFLFENNKKIELNKSKVKKGSELKYSNDFDIKYVKEVIFEDLKTVKTLFGVFHEIINEINKHSDENYRIIIENYDEYLYLIKYIFDNKIQIKFTEYVYFKDSKIYKEVLKYLNKNEFDKVKIKKMIINTSDYYDFFFNYFMYQMLYEFDDKKQFLFYLYAYRNLYLIKEYNEKSNIEIEPLEYVSVEKKKSYFILSSKNINLSNKELITSLKRLFSIENNIKFYKYTIKINKDNFNILTIINDDKNKN